MDAEAFTARHTNGCGGASSDMVLVREVEPVRATARVGHARRALLSLDYNRRCGGSILSTRGPLAFILGSCGEIGTYGDKGLGTVVLGLMLPVAAGLVGGGGLVFCAVGDALVCAGGGGGAGWFCVVISFCVERS